MFAKYFDSLLDQLKIKYPEKKLIFILDNLNSHKSSLTIKVMQDKKVHVLFTPSNTPEFSPVENMFGLVKKKLQDFEFTKVEKVAEAVSKMMFGLKKEYAEGFFKKTL